MITERAMLAAIHISIWTAVKHDRKISHEVASQHGAPVSAGRYNKQLLRGAGRLDDLHVHSPASHNFAGDWKGIAR
jgi:hypothetical protein